MSPTCINDVRCEALFVSTLQRADAPTPAQVRAAVTAAVRRFGSRGCAALMAHEFGDSPQSALERMRWVRRVVSEVFAAPAPRPAPVPVAGRGGWSIAA